MKTVLKSLINAVIWVITLILLFFVISGVYQRFFTKDGRTGIFGIGYAVVVSGSMEPLLHANDFLIFQEQPKENYENGDVVIYVRDEGTPEERLISHRIISIDGDTVIVKGDANELADKPISKDQIVGRMAFFIPKIGAATTFIRTPLGYVCLSVLIVLLIVLNLVGLRKKPKEKTA